MDSTKKPDFCLTEEEEMEIIEKENKEIQKQLEETKEISFEEILHLAKERRVKLIFVFDFCKKTVKAIIEDEHIVGYKRRTEIEVRTENMHLVKKALSINLSRVL